METKKAAPGGTAFLKRLDCCDGPRSLWEVVAEGSEQHIVHALGRNARRAGRYVATARPTALGEVGILQARLKAALGALVELVPEACGGFLNKADIAGASAAAAGIEVVERRGLGAQPELLAAILP